MITSSVIQRRFHLRIGQATGTVFALDHRGRKYLVTASHVLKGMDCLDDVRIFHDGQWKALPCEMVGDAPDVDTNGVSSPYCFLRR